MKKLFKLKADLVVYAGSEEEVDEIVEHITWLDNSPCVISPGSLEEIKVDNDIPQDWRDLCALVSCEHGICSFTDDSVEEVLKEIQKSKKVKKKTTNQEAKKQVSGEVWNMMVDLQKQVETLRQALANETI